MDLLGERWAILVVRELMVGPKRFSDLRNALRGIGPTVLSSRLAALKGYSIVTTRRLPKPASSTVYELSEWGRDLAPVLRSLGRWGARSPHLPQAPMSAAAFVMSLETMFDPTCAAQVELAVGLVFDDEPFLITIDRGELRISRGDVLKATVVVRGDQNDVAAFIFGGRPNLNGLEFEGDRAALVRFASMFPLPLKAPSI